MKVLSGVYWNCGKRSANEDSLTLQQVLTEQGRTVLAAVSDGIGGLSEGETASGYILEQLADHFYQEAIRSTGAFRSKHKLCNSYLRCLSNVNSCMNRYGMEKDLKLGATISLLLLWKKRYLIIHLGDSRIYQYRRGKIKLLTKDHSDGGSGLTKCMGSFPWQYPDIYSGRIRTRTGFLLCTDGFYKPLSMESTADILEPAEFGTEKQIEKRLYGLAGKAVENGGTDNISAIYLRVTM